MSEIKECPNPECSGSKPFLADSNGTPEKWATKFWVICDTCEMSGPLATGNHSVESLQAAAIAKWNALPRRAIITTRFPGEDVYTAVINDHGLDIEEEASFRKFLLGYVNDLSDLLYAHEIELLHDRWKKEQSIPEFRPDHRALYWLTRLKVARQREGWEKSPTIDEVWDSVTSFLFNRNLDAGVEEHHHNIREFLADIEYREKDRGLY